MSDELDTELGRLRDELRAEVARGADSRAALARLKDDVGSEGTVIGLAPRPPAPRNGKVIAAIAAAGLVAASVVAIAWPRGDGDADIVPITEPTTAAPTTTVITPTTSALPVATTAVPTTIAPIALSLDFIAQVQFLDSTHGWMLGQPTGTSDLVLYRTTDGTEWTQADTPASPMAVRFADAQNGWLMSSEHAWSTHDGGATFTQVTAPLGSFDGDPPPILVHDGFVYAVGFVDTPDPGFRVYRSPIDHDDFRDTGISFGFGAGPVADFSLAANGDSVFAIYNDRVVTGSARLTNGVFDNSWTPPAADQGGAVRLTSSVTGPLYSFGQVGTWGNVELANKAFVSDDGGATFRELTLPPNEPNDGTTLIAVDDHTVMAFTAKGVYASTDEGATWTLRSNLPAGATAMTFHTPLIASAVVNTGTTTQLWTSTDGGWSWTRTLG